MQKHHVTSSKSQINIKKMTIKVTRRKNMITWYTSNSWYAMKYWGYFALIPAKASFQVSIRVIIFSLTWKSGCNNKFRALKWWGEFANMKYNYQQQLASQIPSFSEFLPSHEVNLSLQLVYGQYPHNSLQWTLITTS